MCEEIAEHIGLSEFHFQRLFSRWVGISPKRFLQFLTKEYAKQLLENKTNILDVTYEAGLTSPSRLHDLFVTCEAVTPGEFKTKGDGLTITYGFHPSPFGECLLATTDRGICGFYFIHQNNRDHYFNVLQKTWPQAHFINNPTTTRPVVNAIFSYGEWKPERPFRLFVHGTNFQIKVWEALLNIPYGKTSSYRELTNSLGDPLAIRAVASANGANKIAIIVPCHRVVGSDGSLTGYAGGLKRKKWLLNHESNQLQLNF